MGEGHSEETLDIQMRSSVLPSAPGVGGHESSQREDEARHCCVRRPKLWAPQRQLLALTANSPSRPRRGFIPLGGPPLVALGGPTRQKPVMHQLPYFLLLGAWRQT